MRNLLGPVLGGFLADPATRYPSLFPNNSIWTAYRFLLPNLAVASVQIIMWALTFLFLAETHPRLGNRPDLGLRIGKQLARPFKWRSKFHKGHKYSPVTGEQADIDLNELDPASSQDDKDFQECQDASDETQSPVQESSGVGGKQHRAFTSQVLLQIVSLSLLAFHKVSSDAIMPVFLASPGPATETQSKVARSLFRTTGGFNYNEQKIGFILLSQAAVGLVFQATLIPLFLDNIGALKAYRIVLGIYPAMYIFTPILPTLTPALSLVSVLLDLWIKVILSSTAYICSSIL